MNQSPNREVALFSAALELPATRHAAYLDENCADDPTLRLRLEALLRVHQEAIPLLENSVPGAQESPMGAEVSGATVHRLRHRYGELQQAEIANTVGSPAEIDEELRALFAALS